MSFSNRSYIQLIQYSEMHLRLNRHINMIYNVAYYKLQSLKKIFFFSGSNTSKIVTE